MIITWTVAMLFLVLLSSKRNVVKLVAATSAFSVPFKLTLMPSSHVKQSILYLQLVPLIGWSITAAGEHEHITWKVPCIFCRTFVWLFTSEGQSVQWQTVWIPWNTRFLQLFQKLKILILSSLSILQVAATFMGLKGRRKEMIFNFLDLITTISSTS